MSVEGAGIIWCVRTGSPSEDRNAVSLLGAIETTITAEDFSGHEGNGLLPNG